MHGEGTRHGERTTTRQRILLKVARTFLCPFAWLFTAKWEAPASCKRASLSTKGLLGIRL